MKTHTATIIPPVPKKILPDFTGIHQGVEYELYLNGHGLFRKSNTIDAFAAVAYSDTNKAVTTSFLKDRHTKRGPVIAESFFNDSLEDMLRYAIDSGILPKMSYFKKVKIYLDDVGHGNDDIKRLDIRNVIRDMRANASGSNYVYGGNAKTGKKGR